TIAFAEPVAIAGTAVWTITLDQQHGMHHTLGKFRVQLGKPKNPRPVEERRQENVERKFAAWIVEQSAKAVAWSPLVPKSWTTTLPKLELLDDGSLLSSGDLSKRDVYEFTFGPELNGATAIRVEALPDERLPKRGPGRVYYEGPHGDFFLSNITLAADGEPSKLAGASQSFSDGKNTAAMAIDDDLQSGWSINGRQGEP